MAERNDPKVIKTIVKGLESRDEGERNSVAWKLLAAADGGDELVIAELLRRLGDEHPPVRRAAARTLREVVPKDAELAIPLLIGRTGSSSPDARFEVTSALEHFAERGDRRVLSALLDRLEDAEGSVRARAISALSAVSEPDDDAVLVQVCGRLLDSESFVRAAVAEALPSLASPENRKVWTYLTQALRNFRPPPQREDLKEAACRALTRFASHGDVEAIDLIGECIDAEYPQATIAALRALVEVAPCGDLNALEAAAKALGHQEVRTQEIAMEVLERLADRGVEPASAPRATAFEGSWTGAVIKGQKIFWNAEDLITEFEVKGRSIISTVCVDKKGQELPCWGRLNASGVLRWDFGAEWVRSQDGASTLPSLSPAAMTLPPPQDAGEVPASPSRTSEVDDAPACDEKVVKAQLWAAASVSTWKELVHPSALARTKGDARDFAYVEDGQDESAPLTPYRTRVQADLERDVARRKGRCNFLDTLVFQVFVGGLLLLNVVVVSLQACASLTFAGLLDVNLIIVGSDSRAELVLQRRLDAGGALREHDQVPFHQELFTWKPPPSPGSTCSWEVARLRRRFGSTNYGYMRSGPDVVELNNDECYELVVDGQDCVGLRVLRDGATSWHLSGPVLLLGPWDGSIDPPLPELAEACAMTVDVSVQQEEAKPQVYIDGGGLNVIIVSAAYFAFWNFIVYFLINTQEVHVQLDDVDWWWLVPRTMTLTGQLWSQKLADGLLGFPQGAAVTGMSLILGNLVWSGWELAWVLTRSGWRLQYFVMTCIGFEMSSVTQILFGFYVNRWGRVSPHRTGRPQHKRHQALWTAFLFSMNMLLLLSQWIIIVLYVYLDSVSTILAAFFLSLSTSCSELLAVASMENLYVRLVWPRAGDEQRIVWGDHQAPVTFLIGWAHAIAEGSRLISLLCAAINSPGWRWQWLGSLLIMMLCNLIFRHGYHASRLKLARKSRKPTSLQHKF
ncbi:unnamed protein product [Symbiodinium sp. CCMP2592]|nr:unnamed protein product [Symbiodinium sp. CCMP2592]